MNALFYTSLALGAVALIIFLYFRVKEGGLKAVWAKTTTSMLFILTAIFASLSAGGDALNKYGIFIIFGLICGMLGDIWLDLKYCHKDFSDSYTWAGMIAFAVGHIFFLYAIFSVSGAASISVWYVIVPIIAGLLFGVVAVSLDKVMGLNYGKFKLISGIYGGILASMAFSCFSAFMSSEWKNYMWLMMFIGGVFFIVSDLILSGMYFDKDMKKNTPINIILNHATYYIAQFIIASSAILFYC